jgi:hypothetical protein
MKSGILDMFNATAAPLRVPANLRERVHRYVRQHQGGALIAEQAPFRRQLDLWALGMAVACAQGLQPRDGSPSEWGTKFVDTRGVQLSEDLAQLLVTVAAADFGIQDPRLSDPVEIMELANRYAAVGLPVVLDWLEDPGLRQTNIEKVIGQAKRHRSAALEQADLRPPNASIQTDED